MSVAANIVEGRAQRTEREFARFLGYALGSASELEHHLIVARDIQAINEEDFASAITQLVDVRKMLSGLIRTLSPTSSSPKESVPA
jgi:four helix bundle protein